jgi:CheY-specific phosphatase CheX
MNIEFDLITPFYLGARDVFEQLFLSDVSVSDISTLETERTPSDITVSIDITSTSFSGKVYYFMNDSFVFTILNILLGYVPERDLNTEMTRSALLELNNMITGKALTKLSEMGTNYNMSPPEIIDGKGTQISLEPITLSEVTLTSKQDKFTIGFLTERLDQVVTPSKLEDSGKPPISHRYQKYELSKSRPEPEPKKKEEYSNELIIKDLKNLTIAAINEIKDLKGDHDFLLRKNEAVANLATVLINLVK